jgi:hypothetical protein
MDEILNNLLVGEILYTTSRGTQYLFMGRNNNLGVVYSINQEQKTLPYNTISAALRAFNLGEEINAQWYSNYNHHEYESRPCNLSVLNELLARV